MKVLASRTNSPQYFRDVFKGCAFEVPGHSSLLFMRTVPIEVSAGNPAFNAIDLSSGALTFFGPNTVVVIKANAEVIPDPT